MRGNTGLKRQVAQHRAYVASHLGGLFKANDTYGELFADNADLLNNLQPRDVEQVQRVLRETHLAEGRGARFVYLLLMLCSLDDKPLAKCQNLVAAIHDVHISVGNSHHMLVFRSSIN